MITDKMPPIGCSPHWYTNQKRIEDLASAISRWVEYTKNQSSGNTRDIENYELIHKWAYELSEISKLEAELLKKDRKIGVQQ